MAHDVLLVLFLNVIVIGEVAVTGYEEDKNSAPLN